jgi:NAD(P)-dependent dehydrogenase (short-subunit alcohol dehydrogenase family)
VQLDNQPLRELYPSLDTGVSQWRNPSTPKSSWSIEGLSESIRYELRRFNIQVKIIEPGGIRTNFINYGSDWANHPNYANLVKRMKQFSEELNDSLPVPKESLKPFIGLQTIAQRGCDIPRMVKPIC